MLTIAKSFKDVDYKSFLPEVKTLTDQDLLDRQIQLFDLEFGKYKKTLRMHSVEFTVSPAFAAWILENRNTANRPVRQTRVNAFVDIIKSGRWRLSHQGMSIDYNGRLSNGQHRLHAIARADTDVPVYIAFGEDPLAFEVLDTMGTRGGSDTLAILGHKNTAILAGACRLLKDIEEDTPFRHSAIGNDQLAAFVDAHPGLDEAVNVGRRLFAALKVAPTAAAVAAYLISEQSVRRPEIIADFFSRLIDGDKLDKRTPLLILREALKDKEIDNHMRSSSTRAPATVGAIINAWNLHVGRKRTSLNLIRLDTTKPFPQPE